MVVNCNGTESHGCSTFILRNILRKDINLHGEGTFLAFKNTLIPSDKQAAFQALIAHHDPDIIMGCETKITGSVATYSVFPENDNILRKDVNLHRESTFLAFKGTLIIWANLHHSK